jgi:aryl-alcohol dehydrogenase-like predicted oxidoreductase
MDYLNLGVSDLKVSRIGFGCCPMGGYGWGNVEEKNLERSVDQALDGGVNFFDTADIYGLGTSEERLGKFLGRKRQNAVIGTKFGVRQDSSGKTFYDNSPEWLDKALDASLNRLNTDYIDLYQIHYWDNRISLEKIFEHLDRKCQEGKIRSYGVTNVDLSKLEIELPKKLASFSFEYSLANREKESVVKEIVEKGGLNFFSWGSLGQGILSGKYDSSTNFSPDDRRRRAVYKNFHGDKFQENMNMLKKMELLISKSNSKTISQLAVRWILDNIKSSIALIGIKEPQEIVDLISTTNWKLNSEDLEYLDTISQ